MPIHTTILTPFPALALAPRREPARASATLCVLALTACPARHVAPRIDRSEDLVRRWGRGEGSPSLVQILQAPESFGRRLATGLGVLLAPTEVVEVPPRERLYLCSVSLGRLLASTPRGLDSLEQLSDQELEQQVRDWQAHVDEAQRGRDAVLRVIQAREARRQADKGVR